MVAVVEVRGSAALERQPDGAAQQHGRDDADDELAGRGPAPNAAKYAPTMYSDAMREVDHVHDAEDQRQPGGDQEQQDAELQPVERLLEKKDRRHAGVQADPRQRRGSRAGVVRSALDLVQLCT